MHLYYRAKSDRWVLDDELAPEGTAEYASIAARGGPVPAGARAWTVDTGGEWVDCAPSGPRSS